MTHETIHSKEEFGSFFTAIETHPNYVKPEFFGFFRYQADVNRKIIGGHPVTVNFGKNFGTQAAVMSVTDMLNSDKLETPVYWRHTNEHIEPLRDFHIRQLLNEYFKWCPANPEHPNVLALQRMAEAPMTGNHYVAVFHWKGPVESFPAALMVVEEFLAGTGSIPVPGMKDALPVREWRGNVAVDPDEEPKDDMYYLARGMRPEITHTGRLPQYLLEKLKDSYVDEGMLNSLIEQGD